MLPKEEEELPNSFSSCVLHFIPKVTFQKVKKVPGFVERRAKPTQTIVCFLLQTVLNNKDIRFGPCHHVSGEMALDNERHRSVMIALCVRKWSLFVSEFPRRMAKGSPSLHNPGINQKHATTMQMLLPRAHFPPSFATSAAAYPQPRRPSPAPLGLQLYPQNHLTRQRWFRASST